MSLARPGKRDPAPPPLYLTSSQHISYCLTCGRIISSKSSKPKQTNPVKYCSDSCRRHKPTKQDEEIERLIFSLLDGSRLPTPNVLAQKSEAQKGDQRRIITCDEIEATFFHDDGNHGEMSSSTNELNVTSVQSSRPDPSHELVVPFDSDSETARSTLKVVDRQAEGQKHAARREQVRRAARRAVVFGLKAESPGLDQSPKTQDANSPARSRHQQSTNDDMTESMRIKCEAVQQGRVVEPSFAKGNFGIRWRT